MLAAFFGFALHYMLGDEVVARQALFTALWPAVILNLVVAVPVYALVRAIVGERTVFQPPRGRWSSLSEGAYEEPRSARDGSCRPIRRSVSRTG